MTVNENYWEAVWPDRHKNHKYFHEEIYSKAFDEKQIKQKNSLEMKIYVDEFF